MTLTRGFARNAATTPLDARLMDMAGLVCNLDGSPRTGVLGAANADTLLTALGTMNVAVAAAEFVVSKGKSDGVMLPTNDGVVNVPITAAPVSNSRITVIWVKHNDNTTGDANSLPVFGTTDGVAAGVPTKPAIPTGCLELGTLRVYTGTTAANGGANVLTNSYQMTVARGAVVPVRTKAELDTWTTATPYQRAVVLANGSEWAWSGAAWVPRGSRSLFTRPVAIIGTTASLAAIPGLVATVDTGDFTHAAGVFTCVRGGMFLLMLDVYWGTSAAGIRTARITTTTTPNQQRAGQFPTPTAGIEAGCNVILPITFAPGDTFTVLQQQNSGGNLNMAAEVVIDRLA